MKLILFAAAVTLTGGLLYALRIAFKSYCGERSDFMRWPADPITKYPERTGIRGLHEVCFPSSDGTRVAGWYAPSRNRAAIVLVHGTGADRSSLLPETKALADAGFGVLALDLPGQGNSDGKTLWGVPERHAIMAATGWLRGREEVDPARTGGFGFSMGAYVLTQTAVLDQTLRAVTLVSCPNDVVEQNWVASRRWGLLSQLPTYWALRASGMPLDMLPKDVIGAIAPRPILIVGGEFDRGVPPYMASELFMAAREPKALWIVPGASHGDCFRVAPQEYVARLTGFFRSTLLN